MTRAELARLKKQAKQTPHTCSTCGTWKSPFQPKVSGICLHPAFVVLPLRGAECEVPLDGARSVAAAVETGPGFGCIHWTPKEVRDGVQDSRA